MKTFVIIIFSSFLLLILSCEEKPVQPVASPPEVSVIETQATEVPLYFEFVGDTEGFKDIAIRARVEGFLEGMHFQEGSAVQKGALLYTLESQPFEEKVAARMSAVAETEIMLAKTRGDLNRIKPLAMMNAVSQSDLDAAVAEFEASQAAVEAAQANLRAAQIELGYTKITSPISGIIGKSKAKVGDFVGRDPNPVILNTVSQIDTILVNFFITEKQYLDMARDVVAPEADKVDRESPSMELILVDGSVYPHKGKADFVDRQVDSTTGSMLVQASFPNPEKLLRPGQFVRVRVKGQVIENAILIPQRCVMELQGMHTVFVVGADQKVASRKIKVGAKIGSFWVITEGLNPGEQVIYEGLQKVKDGAIAKPEIAAIPLPDEMR
ncbi:MAG: efflux RND transporter periplasmic adaptor subunit [Desulfuromonadales bacterium]|jgi:membrane fusion protein, multidrug efflux system